MDAVGAAREYVPERVDMVLGRARGVADKAIGKFMRQVEILENRAAPAGEIPVDFYWLRKLQGYLSRALLGCSRQKFFRREKHGGLHGNEQIAIRTFSGEGYLAVGTSLAADSFLQEVAQNVNMALKKRSARRDRDMCGGV